MTSNVLSKRSQCIDASGIRKVFALAADLEDPINFSIGQPDFDVPEPLKRRAVEAILRGQNHYSQTQGIRPLCEALEQRIGAVTGWSEPQVLVTSGVSGGLLLAFLALIDPGDEVILGDPYFVIYKHVIAMLGGRCVTVDTYPDFQMSAQAVERLITEKTKLLVINSPANPTGVVLRRPALEALAAVARAHDLIVLSDEIYEAFTYVPDAPSMGRFYEKTLLLRGFSKAYAMTGWRLGYAAVHPCLECVVEAMTKIQQYTFVCAPTPLQWAALEALDFDMGPWVDRYRAKRDLLYEGLRQDFDLVKPEGAFYAFAGLPQGMAATEFVQRAIAENVLVIPGHVFSERDTHIRISYATDDARIRQGAEILSRLVRSP